MFKSWIIEISNRNQEDVPFKVSKGIHNTKYVVVPDVYSMVSGLMAQDQRVERHSTK